MQVDDSSTSSVPSVSGEGAPAEITRDPKTEATYLRRAQGFEVRAGRELGISDPSPRVVAAYALELRHEWSKATWRQNKASLLYRYRSMGTPDAVAAVEALQHVSQSESPKSSMRTSGRRSKAVSSADLKQLLREIRSTRSEYGGILVTWLLLGTQIGLRPHEWCQTELIHASPSVIGDTDVADQETPLPYFKVRNSKRSNGRAHGDYRHLNLSGVDREVVKIGSEFAQQMAKYASNDEYDRIYDGCRKLLLRVNKTLHRNDSGRWVQLYSPRHRFSAEAKLQLGLDGVAALMGHATTKTASQHYGRRSSGSGSVVPQPIAAEVARVRKVRAYQARTTANTTPTPVANPKPSRA